MTSDTNPARLALALSLIAAMPAAAQTAPRLVPPPQADISRQRVQPLPLPERSYDLKLLTPERAAVPRAIDEVEFSVRRIRVTGATVFSDADLARLFASLEGRKIVLDDLRRATEKLEALYRARGYFLTRVLVPPQEVRDETLDVQVLEGFIADLFVEAPDATMAGLGKGMLGPVTRARPVRLVDLESPMLLLNDMPGIRATSVLKPGVAPASSDLVLKMERRPTQSFVNLSNLSSDAIGPLTLVMGTTISQPLGLAGATDLTLNAAGERMDELRVFTIRHAIPVGRRGIVATVGLVVAQARPGGDVSALDLRSHSGSGSVRLRMPLLRTRADALFAEAGFSVNRSFVSALGEAVTADRSSVADVALAWRQVGWLGGDMNLRLGLSQGLLAFGANDRDAQLPSVAGFAPKFQKLTLLWQRNQPLFGPLSVGFVVQGQYSGQRLMSGEQMMFGGSLIGRGYDPSSIIGDKGIGGLAELRLGLPRLSVKGRFDNLQLYGFGDAAVTVVNPLDGDSAATSRLSTLGIGVRALAFRRIVLDAHVASARRTVSETTGRGERINFTATLLF